MILQFWDIGEWKPYGKDIRQFCLTACGSLASMGPEDLGA